MQDKVGFLDARRGHELSSSKEKERKEEQVKRYSHINEDSTFLIYIFLMFRSEQDKFS